MSDTNKQLNKTQEVGNTGHSFNVLHVSLLKDRHSTVYFYKKTEKLASAIYLLTNLISDKEPIKFQLREAGLELLTNCPFLSVKQPVEAVTFFVTSGVKILSLLELAFLANLISEMNHKILRFEFENLIKTVDQNRGGDITSGLVLPENFFAVTDSPSDMDLNRTKIDNSEISKGQKFMSDRQTVLTSENIKDKTNRGADNSRVGRSDIILGLLKTNPELSIKDFTSAIKGCSEKTIQRELMSLISKGQIKKVGEKRWSRYSIK